MHLCRAAWQRLAPLGRGTAALLRTAPLRQMSSGSVPGSSGDALPYYLFVGAVTAGGGFYLYRTLSRDRSRFQDRHAYLENRRKDGGGEESETGVVSEVIEEAAQVVTVAAVAAEEEITVEAAEVEIAEEVAQQETAPEVSLEPEETACVEEVSDVPVATKQVEEDQPAPTSGAAPVQEEQEAVSKDDDASPILEATAEDIQEEITSAAAEDWSELSARKPEVLGDETLQDTEGHDDTIESEAVSPN